MPRRLPRTRDPEAAICWQQSRARTGWRGKNPGQLQLIAVSGEIIEPFAGRAGVPVPHLLQPRPGLAVAPDTQDGTPVITGTRVPYEAVAGLMRDGVTAEQIAEYYPAVTAASARDALDFARYVDSYDPPAQAA